MTLGNSIRRSSIGFVLFLAIAAYSTPSWAECGAFPDVEWWGKLSHAKVVKYVERKHDGNWEPYLRKWQRQKIKLKRWLDTGSSVVIRKKGIALEGKTLAAYIDQVDQRLAVSFCLAAAAGFDDFDTAAGRGDKKNKKKVKKN
jgi:hypothetical protein